MQREIGGDKVVLPVWHEVTREQVARYSPPLADKVAGSTQKGIPHLANELALAMTESATEARVPDVSTEAEASMPAEVKIGYERLKITASLHRYSLIAEVTLKVPPDQGRFRFSIFWPSFIRIARIENLEECEQRDLQGETYKEIRVDSDQRIFPGETRRIIGPGSGALLEYEYDSVIWIMTDSRPVDLLHTLYLEDHLPVKGRKPFKELNVL